MKIKRLSGVPILYLYKDLGIATVWLTEKDLTLIQVRSNLNYTVVFEYYIETSNTHSTHWREDLIVLDKSNYELHFIDLDTFEVMKKQSEYAVYYEFGNCFFGSHYQTRDKLVLDKDLKVLHNLNKLPLYRLGNYLFVNNIISSYESIISIIEPYSGKVCWKKQLKAGVIKYECSRNIGLLYFKEKKRRFFQIIELKSGVILFERDYIVTAVFHDEKENLLFVGSGYGVMSICLSTFKERKRYTIQEDAALNGYTSIIGVSEEGILYNGRMKKYYFGLIDRKTGEKSWEFDSVPEIGKEIIIRKWLPLKNGKHIITCDIPFNSGNFELEI